jgi:hypothetical protein
MRVPSEANRWTFGAAILFPALVACGGDIPADMSAGLGEDGEDNGAVPVLQSGFEMDLRSSFLVTDHRVVDDTNRTHDPCLSTSALDSDKKWTFGYLMKQMANGVSPSTFARSWLSSWENSTSINNDPLVEVRGNPADGGLVNNTKPLARLIREAWERASGGTTLAMNKAPFRLLAIVNRFDLRKEPRNFGEGSSGELRFVFSVLNLDRRDGVGGTCSQYPAVQNLDAGEAGEQLVILEYAVDHSTQTARRDWAFSWAALSDHERGTETFASRLQVLTEKVAVKGAGGTRPNGSALIRIRTNETANDRQWDLREFVINASTRLVVPTTVKQTPAGRLNGSNDLAHWMRDNSTRIMNGTYVVPDRFPTSQGYANTYFRGSHSLNTHSNTFWQGGSGFTVSADVRHEFSKNTCSGCHSQETGSQFFHIHGRDVGVESLVSRFLAGEGVGEDNHPFCTPDPVVPSIQRCFHELQRRADDLLFYVNNGI